MGTPSQIDYGAVIRAGKFVSVPLLDMLHAIWDSRADDLAWQRAVFEAATPLFDSFGFDQGVQTVDFVWSSDEALSFRAGHGVTPQHFEKLEEARATLPDYGAMNAFYRCAPWFGSVFDLTVGGPNMKHLVEATRSFGAQDIVVALGGDRGGGTQIMAMASQRREISSAKRWMLAGLTAHLASATRLRQSVMDLEPDSATAVFDADGSLSHATGDGPVELQERLRQTIVGQRDVTDGKTVGSDAQLDAWASLVDGRYTIVDHFEARGRRWFLLFENPYRFANPAALSERQRDVVALASRGLSNAEIGLSLGLTTSTVGSHLAAAFAKLPFKNRSELVRYLNWESADVSAEPGRGGLQTLELDAKGTDESIELTAAEREVAALAGDGLSNQQIAQSRRVSERTVANQLASIYQKLGVSSRYELAVFDFGRTETT